MAIPAFGALLLIERQLTNSQLDWGPVGSVGFELATGEQVVSTTSDLDLALFAPRPFSRSVARDLWNVISAAPAKVDVCVETPCCGFSLEEYARESTEKLLVRLPANRQLATDPWTVSVIEDEE
jgi:phosphoribosyl-dephospho-CoA transferase